MIRPETLTRLRLLVGNVRPPLVAANRDQEVAPLQPGQAIDARVEQESPSGHLVSVLGRNFEFRLPAEVRPGDWLRLVYVDSEPRPTFALLRIDRSAGRSDATLSEAGRLLAALREPADEAAANKIQSSTPIFPGDIPETGQAAALLRETLSLSGLFYESHQAQWVTDSRTTAQLLQEPQGRLAPLATDSREPAPGTSSAPATSPTLIREVVERDTETPAPFVSKAGEAVIEAELVPARSPAHPDTFPIIRQQLAALETGQVAWRGEVWPGQSMEWEVSDAPDSGRPDLEASRTWRTRLRLTLPELGAVEAQIELGSRGARLKLIADSGSHADVLRSDAAALAQQFSAAGISVAGFEVAQDVSA